MYRGGSVAKMVDADFRVISTNSLTRMAQLVHPNMH